MHLDKGPRNGLMLAVLVAFSICFAVGCDRSAQPDDAENAGHEAHDHGADPHEAHDGEAGEDGLSFDEVEQARCEHDLFTYQCSTCRYEIGVVALPRSLLIGATEGPGGVVRTEVVTNRQVTPGLNVTGEVSLNENAAVHVSPRIPGVIESVSVDIGARVQPGDVLFRIRSVELGRALSDYERSRALTELAEKNLAREQRLFERRVASEREMIEARMVYEQHRTELKAAKQALHVMGLTQRDLAALRGESPDSETGTLAVRASIAGRIIEKHAVIGELVEPGKDVMLLADLSSVWVWADIYEQDLSSLLEAEKRRDIPVEVSVRAFPGRTFPGTIDYVGATMSEATRTVKVRATVGNAEGLLRPGTFCEIRVGVAGGEEALAVPSRALLSDEGRDFVFVHWKEDYYVRRFVKRGREFSGSVEIKEGLSPGQIIVTDGTFLLKSDVLREKMGAGCAD